MPVFHDLPAKRMTVFIGAQGKGSVPLVDPVKRNMEQLVKCVMILLQNFLCRQLGIHACPTS